VAEWLVGKIHSKGLTHLSIEEVSAAYRSKVLPDEWRRVTGHAMPENILSKLAERLNNCGRLRDESVGALEREATGPAFLKAVANGDAEAVNRWLESKDRRRLMDAVDENRRGCVHLASRAGHLEVLRLLHIHGADQEARDRFGNTPLHLACQYAHRELLEVLLQWGCQAMVEDKTGRTPLHLAATCEDSQLCQLLVLRHPGLVNRQDVHCRSPLFYSVLNVHAEAQKQVTRMLLEHMADANARDTYGMAPLHYAAEEGRRSAVVLLLRHHADPTLEETAHGRAPLELAKNEGVRHELQKALGARPSTKAGGSGPGYAPGAALPTAPVAASATSDAAARRPPSGAPRAVGQAIAGLPSELAAPMVAPDLGSSFQVLQERFIRIMDRVQEGGVQQMEHIKRPHLFTGFWMKDVSSHQQLLGQALKYVPGPEVCIRVFNLLRPPKRFPESRGDERDIIAIYEGQQGGRSVWNGSDPYASAMVDVEDDGLSQARRVELMRAIHDQKQELDSKDSQIEDLRRRVEQLQADLRDRGDPTELQDLKADMARRKRQMDMQAEELEKAEGRANVLQGQNRVLQEQLGAEKERASSLLAEQCTLRSQLQAMLTKHGEDQAWQDLFEKEKLQSESLQKKHEEQLRVAEEGRLEAESTATALRAERRQLHAELKERRGRGRGSRGEAASQRGGGVAQRSCFLAPAAGKSSADRCQGSGSSKSAGNRGAATARSC